MRILFCFILAGILSSCFYEDCIKVPLSKEEMKWFDPFTEGDTLRFLSKNNVDTFYCGSIDNSYTTCNKFELGDYQYNNVSVGLKKGSSDFSMLLHFSSSIYRDSVVSCYKRFQIMDLDIQHNGDLLKFEEIISIKDKSFKCLHFKSDKYDNKILESYWSKQEGLLRYVTNEGEVYTKVMK